MKRTSIETARRPAPSEVVLRVERWDRPTARHSARVASLAAAVAAGELAAQAGVRYDPGMVGALLAALLRFGTAGPRPDYEACLGPVRASLRTGRLEIGAAIAGGLHPAAG